jgi:opacity protein-like surface antigen
MKRAMPAVVLVLGLAATGSAIEVGLGFQAGLRTMADAKIREVYGGGMSFFPSLRLVIWRGLEVGAGYEGGYAREGAIGLFEEKTTLSVAGFEGFVGYGHRLNILEPYVRVGFASYAYKQTIESSFMPFEVDHTKSAVTLAAGLRAYPMTRLHIFLEAKYVPLKVKPFDEEVDLSGLRLALGAGYSFRL